MGAVIGIDLGTTYSAVAVVGPSGKPEVLRNRDGENITPSVVLFQSGMALVGTMAKRTAPTAPLDVVEFVKRQMGSANWKFETADGVQLTPEEVSAVILRRLKEDAELHLGEGAVTGAVITVPAYFDEPRRRATMDAGRIAGLNVLRVLNEPTAAALAFGLDTGRRGTILVYDLGGGTFDVTVMRIGDGTFDVLGTDGLHELGGFNWDSELMDHLNAEFQAQGGPDLTETFEDEALLREKAELAKRSLTSTSVVKVALSSGGVSKVISVTRETFEDITSHLLNQSRDLTASLVEELGLSWSDIDDVLLVGGSTRMPMVGQMLESLAGRPPLRSGNPDELVALGAAIQASLEEQTGADSSSPGVVDGVPVTVLDVTSQGLGVLANNPATGRMRNTILIPRNTKIPAKEFDEFTTMHDGQTEIQVEVTQGDSEDPEYVRQLGSQLLTIPPYPAGSPIRITFHYDIDQTIQIDVVDLRSGDSLGTFEVSSDARLSDDEVATATAKNRNMEVN